MREIEAAQRFKKDFKREVKSDPRVNNLLSDILNLLVSDTPLPSKLRDHGLSGEWRGFRDCHVKPDLVLIYKKVNDDVLKLVRLGSHSELFG